MEIIKILEIVESDLAKEKETLAGLKAQALEFKLETAVGLEKNETYKEIKSFRNQKLVKFRTTLEAKRKEVKEPYRQACDKIDSTFKMFTSEILEIEKICKTKEAIVDNEIARIEKEKADKERAILDSRIQQLQAVNCQVPSVEMIKNEDFFNQLLDQSTKLFQIEQERRKQEELERLQRIEADKIKQQELEIENEKLREIARAEAERAKESEAIAQKEREKREQLEKEEFERTKLITIRELARQAQERKLEAETADFELLKNIQEEFSTLELAQAEIFRIYKSRGRNGN